MKFSLLISTKNWLISKITEGWFMKDEEWKGITVGSDICEWQGWQITTVIPNCHHWLIHILKLKLERTNLPIKWIPKCLLK